MYASATRGDIKLSLAMIDIDNFEEITTEHGPETSNAVLETLTPMLLDELRKNDVLARYDSGTFVCLASNVGDHNAIMVFERIRQLVNKTVIEFESRSLSVSCSIGATTFPDTSLLKMINNAQKSLQEAIADGRNCVVVSN